MRKAIFFVVTTLAIGFGVEVLGINTGMVFGGKYAYGDLLGEKVLGVPIVVPLVWFIISYITFSLAFPRFVRSSSSKARYLIAARALAAFGAMAWDLMVDFLARISFSSNFVNCLTI